MVARLPISFLLTILLGTIHIYGLKWVQIDSIKGDDTNCVAMNLNISSSSSTPPPTPIACRTLTRAFELVLDDDDDEHWIQIMPEQIHRTDQTITPSMKDMLTISSLPPPPFDVEDDAPGLALWDCGGAPHCLILNDLNSTRLGWIEFRNVTRYVIEQSRQGSTSNLAIESCRFNGVAGVVNKYDGQLTLLNSNITQSGVHRNDSNYRAIVDQTLIQLKDVQNTTIRGCHFTNNYRDTPFSITGGIIRVHSWNRMTSFHVIDTEFGYNRMDMAYFSGISIDEAGGGLMQVNASSIDIHLSGVNCHHNTIVGGTRGICIGLFFSSAYETNLVTLTVDSSSFISNRQVASPTVPNVETWSIGDVGVIAVAHWEGIGIGQIIQQSGPIVTLNNNTFAHTETKRSGAVTLNGLKGLQIKDCIWDQNTSNDFSTALSLDFMDSPSFVPAPWTIDNCRIIVSRNNPSNLPSFWFRDIPKSMTISRTEWIGHQGYLDDDDDDVVRNVTLEGIGGSGIVVFTSPSSSTITRLEVLDSSFIGLTSYEGGAIACSSSIVTIRRCKFVNNTVARTGGAIVSRASTILITGSKFINNRLDQQITRDVWQRDIQKTYEGGAIAITSGSASIFDSEFVSNSALPSGGLDSCAEYSASVDVTSVTSNFIGGDISLREVTSSVSACTFTQSSSCSGGSIYVNGNAISHFYNDHLHDRAFIGGAILSISSQATIHMSTFIDCVSLLSGGGLALVEPTVLLISDSTFERTRALEQNGGAIWIQPINMVEMAFAMIANQFTGLINVHAHVTKHNVQPTNTLHLFTSVALIPMSDECAFVVVSPTPSPLCLDCSAPLGGGAILFVLRNPLSTTPPLLLDTNPSEPYDLNIIEWTEPDVRHALYGEREASNVMALEATVEELYVYPGESFETRHRNISIFTLDAYGARIIGSSTVIQVLVESTPASPSNVTLPSISGTILQKLHLEDGAALFTDLTFAGTPGEYQLVFSIVGVKSIEPTRIRIIIHSQCPSGLFFDATPSERRCRDCGSTFLVYDPHQLRCEPCKAGWHAIRMEESDAMICAVCPAGSTSNGGACQPCGSNTYQPAPGKSCRSCMESGLDGIQCEGELPRVESGWFAFNRIDGDGTALIATAQCPEGYCSGSVIQQVWIDPIQLVNGSTTSQPPNFTSAITRFDQCAYPRRQTEENILCGECVDGYIPWGDKCAECTEANGGMVALLVILSFGLVLFLLHSASGSASAGHSVILLYFIQTCMLEVGSSSVLLSWLNIALFSPNSTSQCIAPLTVYEQTTMQIMMPVILFGELVIVGFIHAMIAKQMTRHGGASTAVPPDAPISFHSLKARLAHFLSNFSIDLYISAGLAILLFSYTQVTVACLSYLACVDVGGTSVVFTQPSMRCQSSEYQSYLVLVIIAMITFVVGFPLGVLIFLWRRWDLIVASHRYMDRDGSNAMRRSTRLSSMPTPNEVDKSSSHRPSDATFDNRHAVDAVVIPFLTRYSPLFSMYSNRAWFWQVLVLVRRTVFVAFSVTLVRSPASKFLAYSLTHLTSLLVQMHFRPFSIEFFNVAEIVSHLLMILLSQSLTAVLPPYSHSTEKYLFAIVIPPIALYILLASYFQWSSSRSMSMARGKLDSESMSMSTSDPAEAHYPTQKESNTSALEHDRAGVAVELTDIHTTAMGDYQVNPMHRGSVDPAGHTHDGSLSHSRSHCESHRSDTATMLPSSTIASDENEVAL